MKCRPLSLWIYPRVTYIACSSAIGESTCVFSVHDAGGKDVAAVSRVAPLCSILGVLRVVFVSYRAEMRENHSANRNSKPHLDTFYRNRATVCRPRKAFHPVVGFILLTLQHVVMSLCCCYWRQFVSPQFTIVLQTVNRPDKQDARWIIGRSRIPERFRCECQGFLHGGIVRAYKLCGLFSH